MVCIKNNKIVINNWKILTLFYCKTGKLWTFFYTCIGFGSEEMTIHGFRAMARTILDEVLGFRPDFIEHQLAHKVKDPNGRA